MLETCNLELIKEKFSYFLKNKIHVYFLNQDYYQVLIYHSYINYVNSVLLTMLGGIVYISLFYWLW